MTECPGGRKRFESVANQYVVADRDQLFLLPPAMRDWLPENHLAWFVLDVLEAIDTDKFHGRYVHAGPGRPAHHPDQMLALLIYAYANGVRSSRQIQRLCSSDVAYRVICAGKIPDHATIARFRAEHEEAFKEMFVEVLRLCAAAGLASLGTVAIDGTKIAANAALSANREVEWIRAEVERILREADKTDTSERTLFGRRAGNELPPELARRSSRLAHLRAAQMELQARQARVEAEAAERTAADRAAADQGLLRKGSRPTKDHYAELARARIDVEVFRQRAAERAARRARNPHARQPKPGSQREQRLLKAEARLQAAEAAMAEAVKAAKVNVTDPQSQVMHDKSGYLQGYNAQAAVNPHQIVLANAVTQECNDYYQFVPMLDSVQRNARLVGIAGPVGRLLADAGYWSEDNATAAGPDRLIATTNIRKLRLAAREMGVPVGPPPMSATPLEAMEHRLRTAEGAAAYAIRSQTVEPVFGTIKENLGCRRFARRGFSAVQSEWNLVCAVHNLLKLFRQPGRLRPTALVRVTV
jgi:transposase